MTHKTSISTFTLCLLLLLLGCGESDSNGNKVIAPTTLSSFGAIKFVGSSNSFINISGGTSGVTTRNNITASIEDGNVEYIEQGNFSYSQTGNSTGKLSVLITTITFTGDLNATVTTKAADDIITSVNLDELEEYDLTFSDSPLAQSNNGTFRVVYTKINGSQSTATGTFELVASEQFSTDKFETSNSVQN